MRENTLHKILSALVDDYGYQTVRTSLEDCSAVAGRVDTSKKSISNNNNKTRSRPNAIAVVERLAIDDEEKKNVLMILAKEYESKAFMPNANNVRAFLAQQGRDASGIKSRQQAVTTVFNCLANWETPELHELHKRGTYGGPKSLSVIAKSIANAGQQSRL